MRYASKAQGSDYGSRRFGARSMIAGTSSNNVLFSYPPREQHCLLCLQCVRSDSRYSPTKHCPEKVIPSDAQS